MVRQPLNPVLRTCTELHIADREYPTSLANPRTLDAYRDHAAYVLLGEPGLGKSTVFQSESDALGTDAVLICARDFITFDVANRLQWREKTLFIDGLDEIRAGSNNPKDPLDLIRRNLDTLGNPRFRISCRHADWLHTDYSRLIEVSSNRNVTVLSLDPLDVESTKALLKCNFPETDPDSFIQESHKRGVDALLSNPQTLLMLADSVLRHDWPSSRKELFEQACLSMAKEVSDEHLDANKNVSAQEIIDESGRIYATLLLADKPGCATTMPSETVDYPYIAGSNTDADYFHEATATNLFRREVHRVQFVHRRIAEYLAARYLASLIDCGLPTPRVLAHMTGSNGHIVSSLRGLSAWLAVHSSVARGDLLVRDPVSFASYGDLEILSVDELAILFKSLISDPLQLEPTHTTAKAVSSLVKDSMVDVLLDALRSPPCESHASIVVDFILRLFSESPPNTELQDTFTEFVRDRSQPSHVKEAAVDALIRNVRCTQNEETLKPLADDIYNGYIQDPNDELLGKLLSTLFPEFISISRIWDYFRDGNENFGGAYMRFWTRDLPALKNGSDIAHLLDACVAKSTKLSERRNFTLRTSITRLLVRGLEGLADEIDIPRLVNWLDTGIALRAYENKDWKTKESIRQWIERRPHLQAKIVAEGVVRCSEDSPYEPDVSLQHLYGAKLSVDFFRDLVTCGTGLAASHPNAAMAILRFVVRSNALDHDLIAQMVTNDEELSDFVEDLRRLQDSSLKSLERNRPHSDVIESLLQRDREEYEALKKLESELTQGSVRPAVLHYLAKVYFDDFLEYTHESAMSRIEELARSDQQLTKAIQESILQVAKRSDLPSVDETLKLARMSQLHVLGLPLLASIALAEADELYDPSVWSDEQMRKALAIYFAYSHGRYSPSWYRYLIANKPVIVATVQSKVVSTLFNDDGRHGDTNLWKLAFNPDHRFVAKHAAIANLKNFPIGTKNKMLSELEYILIAAFRYAERTEFRELIESKVALRSMPPRQRARWLAVGCALELDKYEQTAKEFLSSGRTQTRKHDFLSFFCSQPHDYSPVKLSDLRLQAFLIQVSAPFIDLEDYERGGFVNTEMDMSRQMNAYLQNLAKDSSLEASKIFETLLHDSNLSEWRELLIRLSRDQERIRTEREYKVPDVTQVIELLKNGLPSNAADLASLLTSLLDEFIGTLRGSTTDDWKRFWCEDGRGNPTKPKSEDFCTKVLLRDLEGRLPKGVAGEPFPSYPMGTYADMKFTYKDFNVPIEAKGSWNEDLWHAAIAQLLTKYTIDPSTDGFGIYLVYWFGPGHTKRAPHGSKPSSAEALQRELEDMLNEQERLRIFIRVIDLSKSDKD